MMPYISPTTSLIYKNELNVLIIDIFFEENVPHLDAQLTTQLRGKFG
jgi:hypothetical protein